MAKHDQRFYSTPLPSSSLAMASSPIAHAESLLRHYSFDLGNQSLQDLLEDWQAHYSPKWIRLAVIEALYQGRYKAISVDEILKIWRRRRHPTPHFSGEFERLVGDRFPRNLLSTEQRKALPRRLQPDDSAWMNLARQTLERHGKPSKARSNQLAQSSQRLTVSSLQTVDARVAQSTELTALPNGVTPPELENALDVAIHQFVPNDVSPEFCNKLKAVANGVIEHLSPLVRSLNDAEEDGVEPPQVAAMSSDAEALLVQSSEHGTNHSNDHPNTHHLSDLVAHDSENHNLVMNHLENAEPGLIDRMASPNTAHSL